MSRLMGFLPMPMDGMMEFQQQEMERINQLPTTEKYEALASISRIDVLVQSINSGYSTPEMRAELEHRFATDPSVARMVEAGRAELQGHFENLYNDDTNPELLIATDAMQNFIMTADIALIAKMDVTDMHYQGLKERDDLLPEEQQFVDQMDTIGFARYMVNPAAEIGDMLLNPNTATVEAGDMVPGFGEFSETINQVLKGSPSVLNELAEKLGGTTALLNEASARSSMNNGFAHAASNIQPVDSPQTDQTQAPSAPTPAGIM